MGFAAPAPLRDAPSSWVAAYRESLGLGSARVETRIDDIPTVIRREDEAAFLESLVSGDPDRARWALERLLEEFRMRGEPSGVDRYRLIGLFAEACRNLESRGFLGAGSAHRLLDLEDLRSAPGMDGLAEAALARFSALAVASGKAPRWSVPVARALAYIRENYSRPISLQSVAAEISLSPGRLSRIFAEETGRSFSEYLTGIRIEKAKELLSEPGSSVKVVSAACGYPDPNYFARLFKKETGYTPSVFAAESKEVRNEKS